MSVFSNGPAGDFVINPYSSLVAKSKNIYIAAPYVTNTLELLEASKNGITIHLLVGLNVVTRPDALRAVHEKHNIEVRYYTDLFHAKIYLFDDSALVGSSNLTDGGMKSNREATIRFNEHDDFEVIQEIRTLFQELWEAAPVLTKERLQRFAEAYEQFKPKGNPDGLISGRVGAAVPPSVKVLSRKKNSKRLYLEGLRRQVSAYRTAFTEVKQVLAQGQFHRAELEDIGEDNQTNLFLNWVKLSYAPGEDSWKLTQLRTEAGRREEVLHLGSLWKTTNQNKIAKEYFEWLRRVQDVFGSRDSIEDVQKEELTRAILSIHAFNDRSRFVKGGLPNLPADFWDKNSNDVVRIKQVLKHLIHGGGEFIERLHDLQYDPASEIKGFGLASALELYGTIKPADFPPVNGRIAKALRYLGFDVQGGVN